MRGFAYPSVFVFHTFEEIQNSDFLRLNFESAYK